MSAKGIAMNLIENDKNFIQRAQTDATLGQSLRSSMQFVMATQRLAAAGWFWSEAAQSFVAVSE